jgi:hypothetical protein
MKIFLLALLFTGSAVAQGLPGGKGPHYPGPLPPPTPIIVIPPMVP